MASGKLNAAADGRHRKPKEHVRADDLGCAERRKPEQSYRANRTSPGGRKSHLCANRQSDQGKLSGTVAKVVASGLANHPKKIQRGDGDNGEAQHRVQHAVAVFRSDAVEQQRTAEHAGQPTDN